MDFIPNPTTLPFAFGNDRRFPLLNQINILAFISAITSGCLDMLLQIAFLRFRNSLYSLACNASATSAGMGEPSPIDAAASHSALIAPPIPQQCQVNTLSAKLLPMDASLCLSLVFFRLI